MKIKSKKYIERENAKKWREEVLKRDNFKCCVCGKLGKKNNNHVHHIIPRKFKEYKFEVNNGITLCYYHHKVGKESPHMNAIWFAEWLKKNKKELYEIALNRLNIF